MSREAPHRVTLSPHGGASQSRSQFSLTQLSQRLNDKINFNHTSHIHEAYEADTIPALDRACNQGARVLRYTVEQPWISRQHCSLDFKLADVPLLERYLIGEIRDFGLDVTLLPNCNKV